MDGLAIGGLKKRAKVSVESASSCLVGHYDNQYRFTFTTPKKGRSVVFGTI